MQSEVAESTCPDCQQYNAVWTGGIQRLSFPKVAYTDGRNEGSPAHAFRDALPIIRCTNCGRPCRVTRSETHTGFGWRTPRLVRDVIKEDCYVALEEGDLNPIERREVLLALLRLSNDPTRHSDSPITHTERSDRWRGYMEECIVILQKEFCSYENRIAEIQREMGDFNACLSTLATVKLDADFLYRMLGIDVIRELAEQETSSVGIKREWREPGLFVD